MNKKVLVIGAGIGGLSAAIRLQKAGYRLRYMKMEDMPAVKCIKSRRRATPLT
jgi:phytoene desaturase